MASNPPPPRLQQLLDRAAADPDYLQQLSADPLGTARAAGLEVNAQHLKHLVGLPDATDAELVDVLRQRVSHGACDFSNLGCGECSQICNYG